MFTIPEGTNRSGRTIFIPATASNAINNHIEVIITGAGGAAHLPGMVASMTTLPVIGVPVQSKALNGI